MSEEGKAKAEARRAARIAELEAAQRTPTKVGGKDRATRKAERAAAGSPPPSHPKIAKFLEREDAKKGGGKGGGGKQK